MKHIFEMQFAYLLGLHVCYCRRKSIFTKLFTIQGTKHLSKNFWNKILQLRKQTKVAHQNEVCI